MQVAGGVSGQGGEPIVEPTHGDDALAGGQALDEGVIRGGVELYAGVQRCQIVQPLVAAQPQGGAVRGQTADLRAAVGGQPHQLLVYRVGQVCPVLGGGDGHAPEHVAVDGENDRVDRYAVPIAVRIAVGGVGQVSGVDGRIGQQLAVSGQGAAGIRAAAEPYVAPGAARLGSGNGAVSGLDVEQLFKLFAQGRHIRLVAGAAHGQAALLAGGVDQRLQAGEGGGVGGRIVRILRAAGAQGQCQQQGQRCGEHTFHRGTSLRPPKKGAARLPNIIAETAVAVKFRREVGDKASHLTICPKPESLSMHYAQKEQRQV